MPTLKVADLDPCAKAVGAMYSTGSISEEQKLVIKGGHLILREFMADLMSPESKYREHIQRALEDVHPKNEYCADMLVRDMADVCITLNRLGQGGKRSEDKKLLDAMMLCQYLKNEFDGVALG